MQKKNIIKNVYWIYAFLLTELIFILCLAATELLPGQRWLFTDGDALSQVSLCNRLFWEKIKSGENLYYSFYTGLGMNDSLFFSFETLSPFHVVYLFVKDNNVANLIAYALKMGFAAICFQWFCYYNLELKNHVSIIFSVYYAMMSYGFVIKNMNTLYDAIYFLPLILVLIKYFVDKKKMVWLSLAYGLLFLSNFYGGYLVGLFSFGYFLYYIFILKNYNFKLALKIFGRYCIAVAIAFMLSAFWILPTAYQALHQNVIDEYFTYEAPTIWNFLAGLFPGYQMSMYRSTPYLYSGIPMLFLVPAFFANKNIKRKEKVFLLCMEIFFIIASFWSPLYIFLHMFNDPTGYTFRYAYLFVFLNIAIATKQWKQANAESRINTFLLGFISISIFLSVPFLNKLTDAELFPIAMKSYAFTVLFVIIWVILWKIMQVLQNSRKEKTKNNGNSRSNNLIFAIALVCTTCELLFNGTSLLTGNRVTENTKYYSYNAETSEILAGLEMNEYEPYRINYLSSRSPNESMRYNYYSQTIFSSSSYVELKEFLNAIGLCCTDFEISDYGITDFSRLLLSEKYTISVTDRGIDMQDYSDVVSGMCFLLNEDIMDYSVSGNNVFRNQNEISKIIDSEILEPFELYENEIEFETENVSYVYENNTLQISLNPGSSGGSITLKIPHEEGRDSYGWLSIGANSMDKNSPIVLNEELQILKYAEPFLSSPFAIKLQTKDDYDVINIIFLSQSVRKLKITDMYFAYNNNSITNLKKTIDGQSVLVQEWGDGYVSCEVSAKDDKQIAYFSIPYEEGWSAYVDGEKTEINPLFDDAFIGVKVPEGQHEIVLKFYAPLAFAGIVTSLIGTIVCFIILLLESFVMNNKKIDTNSVDTF